MVRILDVGRRKPLSAVSAVILAVFVLTALMGPLIAPYSPTETHPADALKAPSTLFFLGTDQFGRDVLSRLIYGARISLLVGGVVVAINAIVGTAMGTISGYLG